MNYCLLNCLLFCVVFQFSEQANDDDAECDYGWRYYENPFTQGFCVLAGTATTWPEASQFCRKHQAKIMTEEERNGYQDFLVIYEQSGWSGELVKYGRLVKNEDKTLVAVVEIDSSTIKNSDTGCSSYFFDIFPTENQLEEASPIKKSLTLQSSLNNCTDQKLPFMCTKNQNYETIKLSAASICPNGWLGNESLSTCYKLFHEVYMDYWTAKLSCERQGGGLMDVHTDTHLERALQIITSPLYRQSLSQADGFGSINLWINGRDESCNSIFPEFNRTFKWSCESDRPYICSKPVAFNSSNPILSLSRYSSQEIPIRIGESEILLPSTQIDEANPEVFRCLLDNLNPGRQSIQWVKDGAFLTSFGNDPVLTLDGTLSVKLSDEGTGAHYTVTEEDKLGYYWCEVLDLKSNSMKASNKFYLNYRGTRTYAASLKLSDGLVDQLSANSFNLMRYRSFQVEIILNCFNNNTLESPTVKLNRFRSEGRIIDFQVFENSLPMSRITRSLELTQSVIVENARKDFVTKYTIKSISNDELIKFVSTDYCLETKRRFAYDDGTIKEFILPDTRLGSVWYTPDICPMDQLPIGKVVCDGDKIYGAYWSTFQLNKNCQFTDHSSSSVSDRLAEIAKTITNSSNIDDIIQEVQDLTDDADKLTPKDIGYTTTILDKIVDFNTITKPNAIGIVNILNNIQDSKETILETADKDSDVIKTILTTLDRLDTKLITGNNNFLSVVTPKTVLEIRDFDPEEPLQIGLSANGGMNRPVTSFKKDDLNSIFNEHEMVYGTADVGIYLNREFVRKLTNELKTSRIRLAMRLFNDSTLFISKNSTANRFLPNSKIISATLLVNDIPYTDLNNTYITSVFLPYKPLQTDVRNNFSICAFWNIEAGEWSSEGCVYENTTSRRDVCICDHLTNFAVLLDYYGQDYLIDEIHRLALSIITYIGLSLSIIGLGLTVLSFLLFSKLRKGRPQQTRFNLALAMLCSWIVFLAGINQTDDHGGCIAVAVLLHYFILASFMWMLMEGILQYLLFVRVLGTYFENYMWKTAIPAWVLPLVPIIVMLAIDIELYNGGDTYCWMSLTGFYYGFAVPVGVIILANIIIYVMVTYSICNRRNINTSGSVSTSRTTLTNIRASFCCFIILGVSWIFGFLAISDARVAFQYIFTIVNSLQGFLIFALFTLRDKNVRDYWKELCCCGLKSKEQSSKNKTESTAKNSSDLNFSDVRKKSNPANDVNRNNKRRPVANPVLLWGQPSNREWQFRVRGATGGKVRGTYPSKF